MDSNTVVKTKSSSWIKCFLVILLICSTFPGIESKKKDDTNFNSIKTKFTNWINGGGSGDDPSSSKSSSNTLSIIEISEMRVRDIKRRLSRDHGYGADEIAMMLDKKELINALAFEEHKVEQKERERKKRVALRRSIIVALICVVLVMFKGLFVHVYEVASVNFVVYTGECCTEGTCNNTPCNIEHAIFILHPCKNKS